MRLASLFALALVAPFATASDGGGSCEPDETNVNVPLPAYGLAADLSARECPEGRWLFVAVTAPVAGRTSVDWYDDERGRGIEITQPPRFILWTDTDQGCVVVVYTYGADEFECGALGTPPPPPMLP